MQHIPPFKPDRRLFPFESKWYESAVGPVHYIDEGSGPPILFLHGNPTWSFLYRGLVIRLRKNFRCIALDYPGFGLSSRPEDYGYTAAEHADIVTALVRHLDLNDLTIMGQDWGGPIGMRLALDETARLRALVMGNTLVLKQAAMIHVLVIASGFVLRAMAGAVAIPVARPTDSTA